MSDRTPESTPPGDPDLPQAAPRRPRRWMLALGFVLLMILLQIVRDEPVAHRGDALPPTERVDDAGPDR